MTPTDPHLPDHPDHELVSRVLDGDASQAERRRVEADPALRAQLAAVTEAAAAVGTPVPVPEGSTRRAVAAALAAADELDAQVPTVGSSTGPIPLAGTAGASASASGTGTGGGSGRARRRRAAFAVAAAVLVAVLVPLGVLVVARGDGQSQSDLASSGEQADEGSSATSAEDSAAQVPAGGAGEAPTDGFATSSGPGAVDLGDATTADVLVALARGQLVQPGSAGRDPGAAPTTTTSPSSTTTIPSSSPSSGGTGGGEPAPPPLAGCLEGLGLPADQAQVAADHPVATGTVDGVPVVVTLSDGPDGLELIAWQVDGCVILSRQPLSP